MMSRTGKQEDKMSAGSEIRVDLLVREMERNFSRFMTKLGAHIAHLAYFGTKNAARAVKNFFGAVSKKAQPKTEKVKGGFDNIKEKVFGYFRKTEDYFYSLSDRCGDALANEGRAEAAKIFIKTVGNSIWNARGGLVTAFNWVAPVVSIVFLVSVVSYATKLNYGISVECNGENIGVISKEADYDEAEKALQERITYVEGNEKIVLKPKLSVTIVKDSSEIIEPEKLVDKMIVSSDEELSNAYGIYVDGKFLGAVVDRKPVMNALASILAKYQSSDVKSISFQKTVEYKQGVYLKTSIVKAENIISVLTSNTQSEAYYTIQKGDTPLIIASKNGLTLAQLKVLNPTIEDECQIGQKVLLNKQEPYMPVKVVKNVQYTETLQHDTVKVESNTMYKGNQKVLTKGEDGEAYVTAEVTYVNGYEVGRTIISSVITKEPVTEKIAVGTLTPKPTSGAKISGNGKYAWPVAGGYISAYFGDGRGHKGVDIAASAGTSIFAAESGTVIMSQWYYGYGNCIMIRNNDGNVTVYGHQSKLIATVGQKVEKGQLIGLVGRTGQATGNHLHFEVRVNGKCVNPMGYIG